MIKKSNQKAITLIALVITIVVLLILAGVSIATLTGENGIITQAIRASEEVKVAEIKERIDIYYTGKFILGEEGNPEEILKELADADLLDDSIINKVYNTIDIYGHNISYYNTNLDWNNRKGVNSPKLSQGMIPIKYDEAKNNWVICSTNDQDWYEYINQSEGVDTTSKWANVMLSDGNYKLTFENTITREGNSYKEFAVYPGMEVTEEELGSMFVWIPRYAYSITDGYQSNIAGNIEIKFLKDSTDVASDGTNNWDNTSGEGNWNVHPAFTFGEKDLTGLWVAKFESSNNGQSKIAVAPNVNSWRNQEPDTIFTTCLNMNDENNAEYYGISADDNIIDPHLIKNTEWGAVSYLTYSSYGRNMNEVERNISYTTGEGDYINNQEQSTTGNVTGIYDMSAGSWEYTAAYIDNDIAKSSTRAESLISAEEKYKDVYSIGATDSAANNYIQTAEVYGDAIYEVSSSTTAWLGDFMIFPSTTFPFFRRSSDRTYQEESGIFAVHTGDGIFVNQVNSFRVVLSV